MSNLWKNEPAGVIAAVQAIIALAIAFGLNLTSEQIGAIVAVITVIGGLLIRSQVASVAALKEFAAAKAADRGYVKNNVLVTVLIVLGIIVLFVLLLTMVDIRVE